MWSFFAHFCHVAGRGGELVLHRADLDLFVQGGLRDEIFLVDFADGLRPEQGGHFWLVLAFLAIDVEALSLGLVILVSFLLCFEGEPFLVDFSLREHAGLDVYFLFPLVGFEVHFDSIVPFPLVFHLRLFPFEGGGVV